MHVLHMLRGCLDQLAAVAQQCSHGTDVLFRSEGGPQQSH
jgi:hypothetical protein